nr:MAG TPA: hypothetical protein [Bacteriophage sp.]
MGFIISIPFSSSHSFIVCFRSNFPVIVPF